MRLSVLVVVALLGLAIWTGVGGLVLLILS